MSMMPLIKYANKSFTLPDTCVKIRQLLDDPMSSSDDIAQIISLDPSLAAKVLKLANSALFRFPSQVTSVNKALGVIGGEAAYNITMAETANLAFKALSSEPIDFKAFWEKAVMQGLIARSIAQQIQNRGSERFFVMGILMNLAELICATKLQAGYKKYLDAKDTMLPLEAQRAAFGFTFCHCSGRILESFQLPANLHETLTQLTLFPHQQLSLDESVLYMAAAMAEKKEGKALLSHEDFNLQATQSIGLNDYEYDIIFEFAQSETFKIAQAIN
ncbi:HDOD domain-containing protein [Glaciecola sp. 2405UD65-10]|uniref:HDOD domain-containing protein n=1 Tax=Glaciecola sp. 2405UD65-10 TaxID=3397244 RepID=UPI003B5B1965